MTSYYKQIPTLAMRARAATLIVVGRLGKTLRTDIEEYEGKSYLRTTYEVRVERVLKGTTREQAIAVQVLSGETTHDAAPKTWFASAGGELVLMLSEGIVPGTYVPYLGSAFPMSDTGRLELGEHATEMIDSIGGTKVDERSVSLDTLARLIDEVVSEEVAAREQPAAVPAPVTEMPGGHEGGGKHSAPEVLPDRNEAH